MSTVGVFVGNVGVAGQFRVDLCVRLDTLKAVLDMVLLRFGFVGGMRSSLAFVAGSRYR